MTWWRAAWCHDGGGADPVGEPEGRPRSVLAGLHAPPQQRGRLRAAKPQVRCRVSLLLCATRASPSTSLVGWWWRRRVCVFASLWCIWCPEPSYVSHTPGHSDPASYAVHTVCCSMLHKVAPACPSAVVATCRAMLMCNDAVGSASILTAAINQFSASLESVSRDEVYRSLCHAHTETHAALPDLYLLLGQALAMIRHHRKAIAAFEVRGLCAPHPLSLPSPLLVTVARAVAVLTSSLS